MSIWCKCKVADVDVQVEINFAKAPITSYSFKRSFSIFSRGCRAAWIDVHETQPSRTKCRSSKTEWSCNVGLGRVDPFPRNASQSSKTAEIAILRNPSAFRFSKLRWNYVFLRSDGFATMHLDHQELWWNSGFAPACWTLSHRIGVRHRVSCKSMSV